MTAVSLLKKVLINAVTVFIFLAVIGCGGSSAMLANTSGRHLSRQSDLRAVQWRLVVPPDDKAVRISSTAEYCYGAPKPKIAAVKVRYREETVVLTALLSNSQGGAKGACMRLRVGLERSVELVQGLRGRAIYDGWASPPEKRWPRP